MEYNKAIVGRKHEQKILQTCCISAKAELIAVYGRRRIGKTYLVKQFFNNQFDFYATGVYMVSRADQLRHWQEQLYRYSGVKRTRPKDWMEAFSQLRDYLETLAGKERIVIFIDEMPWLDTPKSGFLRALDLFWNSWAADNRAIKMVVCGSATTWMTNKLLGDKGGLHNRVTRPIHLMPFTLAETEKYLESIGIEWSRQEILNAYMVMGGTPFYLSLLRRDLSLDQNVNELFFGDDAVLKQEYGFLFKSLFNEGTLYRRIVEVLSSTLKGMTRKELLSALKIIDNGAFTEALENLEKCDFLRRYLSFGKKEHDALYQLTDMYTLFYFRFIKGYDGMDSHAWSNMSQGKINAWSGYAFEQVCLLHVRQIKNALGISGIASDVSSWNYSGEDGKAQIDLIIDRSDQCIDLCEMKYSDCEYELTKEYVARMKERREMFRKATHTRKTLRLTMVVSSNLKQGKYSSSVQGVVDCNDLFTE